MNEPDTGKPRPPSPPPGQGEALQKSPITTRRLAVVSAPTDPKVRELEALRADIRSAADLQKALLPKGPPGVSGYEFGIAYYGAKQISGDLYDFFQYPDGRVGIVIADASGKGVSAALLITLTRALLHAASEGTWPPEQIMSFVNHKLHGFVRRGLFVSMTYVILDPSKNVIQVSNAGHLPTLVWRSASRTLDMYPATGIVLGAGPSDVFESRLRVEEVPVGVGDRVVLLTDGVNEAMAPGKREFGMEHLRRRLESDSDRPSAEFIKYVMEQIEIHMAGGEQSDDITIVTFRRRLQPPSSGTVKAIH